MKQNIFDINSSELKNLLNKVGEKSYRAKQIYQWIFQKKITDFSMMSSLSKNLRSYLEEHLIINLPKIIKLNESQDGSQKFLLELSDKSNIEMVLIPHLNKNTLCISSQVGCARKCSFCATAQMGLIRNLTVAEIVGQVYLAQLELREKRLTNIVFMGMGEPFDNYDNVISAVRMLQNEEMFGISPRRITISTSGVIPGINKLTHEGVRVKLAISLNSAIPEKRKILMPITSNFSLPELKKALQNFSHKTHYHLTFEYVMIKKFNMGKEDIKALVKFVGDLSCKINLIPWNSVSYLSYESPSKKEITEFSEKLKRINSAVTTRKSRGTDINAACGQLAFQPINQIN